MPLEDFIITVYCLIAEIMKNTPKLTELPTMTVKEDKGH